MTDLRDSICPGCGLWMPVSKTAANRTKFNATAECWDLYTEVLCEEFSNAFLFGQVHTLTVDTYAVQHAGGSHPDKSVDVHLCGLYLVLERGFRSPYVPPLLQRLVAAIEVWPHFPPPIERGSLTVCDVALCGSVPERIKTVREWARVVWDSWAKYHTEVSGLVSHHLKLD